MDSLLLIGCTDPNLEKALRAFGYQVAIDDRKLPLQQLVLREMVDLVLLDGRGAKDPFGTLSVLRDSPETRRLPLVVVCNDEKLMQQVQEMGNDRVEPLAAGYTLGEAMSKIATALRLRKMAGVALGEKAGLAEVNSALKDLNARFKREIEDAQNIQKSLLPEEMPRSEMYQVAACYLPLEEVGGDMYFVEREAEGKVSLHIADVTGHGLAAAFIGSMTKLAMAAVKAELPHERLKGMNKLISPQLPPGRFVTIASILYDPADGKLWFARGGHPPAMVVDRSKKEVRELLGADGFAFGFDEDGEYTVVESQIGTNDIVVILTDGILEAPNRAGELYGKDRLARLLQQSEAALSSEEIIKLVLNDFREFTDGRRLKDDVTMLVLKRLA